ncbi:MAG TPA: DNA-directed RNA polymerase subunit alpha [Methylomirabilota bacterium]|nr:DNA-directed RNA polymerase subunit alpha [Methylomirabilota bacterium]
MPRLMFERPRRIEWEELAPRFGRMVAEPFEKGYALTVGNSLRRVLLAAVPGAAVAWVRVEPASLSPADTTSLLLNAKKLVVRLTAGETATARLSATGPTTVTAGNLSGAGVEILNPDLVLATLEAGARLTLEVGVRIGRGYVSADRHPEPVPAGAIALDAAFSPIRRVNYAVEMSRLGNITDYEKLVVEISTDGSITPDQSLLWAAKLLRDHFDLFTPTGAEEEDDDPAGASPAGLGTVGEAGRRA